MRFVTAAMAQNIVVIASRFNECCRQFRQFAEATVVVNLVARAVTAKVFHSAEH